MDSNASVCVIGTRAADVLFPMGGAVGSVLTVDQLRYRVVGVMSALPRGEVQGKKLEGDPSEEVFAPLTTLKGQFGETILSRTTGSFSAERVQIHQLFVKVGKRKNVIPASKVIGRILEQNHERKDYEVIVPLQLLEQAKQTQRIFSIVLGSIAAISLLVGGIGIMNITLATVMERTREIGIRRAMGAKKVDIVAQFLSETVLLAAFGGGLGIAFGILGPYLVRHFTEMSTVVTAWSLILAFSISAIVGLAFGIYPAYRAANMDPIEALRHE
jgi:putative ABC transport system permease protein